jgi:hypothetical protein
MHSGYSDIKPEPLFASSVGSFMSLSRSCLGGLMLLSEAYFPFILHWRSPKKWFASIFSSLFMNHGAFLLLSHDDLMS